MREVFFTERSRQLESISEVEKRLWAGADTLRANSNFASNEYFLPVMGLIFLRHAYSRFLKVKEDIEGTLPSRGGKRRDLTKEDFSRKGAIFLREKAQFDYLVERPDSEDRAKAVIEAMTLIEGDYQSLKGDVAEERISGTRQRRIGTFAPHLQRPSAQEGGWR